MRIFGDAASGCCIFVCEQFGLVWSGLACEQADACKVSRLRLSRTVHPVFYCSDMATLMLGCTSTLPVVGKIAIQAGPTGTL